MVDNRIMLKKAAAFSVAGATMLGLAVGSVVTANAATTSSNDITITTAKGNVTTTDATQHTLTAYKLASYENVVLDGDTVKNYGLKDVDGISEATFMAALQAAFVTDGAVNSNWTSLLKYDSLTGLSFTGNASNLSPMQFVAKYMYGTGTDTHTNTGVDGHETGEVDGDAIAATTNEIRRFAEYLKDHGELNNLTSYKSTAASTGDSTTATIDIPDGQEGIYLILDTNATDENGKTEDTLSRAMIVGTAVKKATDSYVDTIGSGDSTIQLGTITLKADNVTVEKTRDSQDTLNVGETQAFTINTFIPNYDADEYANPVGFTVNDTLSSNLTLNTNSVEVTVTNGKDTVKLSGDIGAVDSNDTGYYFANGKVAKDTGARDLVDKENSFSIALTRSALKTYSGYSLVVKYNATVQNVTNETTDNTASVVFSNDPYNNTFAVTNSSNTRVVQADLALQKIAMMTTNGTDKNYDYLDGAKFKVTTSDGTMLKWRAGTSTIDGKTYNTYELLPDNTTDSGTVTEITLNTASNAKDGSNVEISTLLQGLLSTDNNKTPEATTYTLTETEAPTGYVLGVHPLTVEVTITPAEADGVITGFTYALKTNNYDNFIDESDASVAKVETMAYNATDGNTHVISGAVRLENTTNPNDLAKTGGDIISILITAAVLAAAGAGIGIAAKKRRASQENAAA